MGKPEEAKVSVEAACSIERLEKVTNSYIEKINDLSMEMEQNPSAIKSLSNHEDLPKGSIVLPGRFLFDYFKDVVQDSDWNQIM